MGSVLKFLTRYTQEGNEFLDSTVTGDETWVFHHTHESKQQSLQWRHTDSPRTQKIQNFNFSEKKMASIFWVTKGILLVDFMPPGSTINAAAYYDTLTRLWWAIQNKRRGMLSRGMCLPHNNARLSGIYWTIRHTVRTLCPVISTCFFTWRNISPRKSSMTIWWGARRCHDMVERPGSRLLWLGDTETGSKA